MQGAARLWRAIERAELRPPPVLRQAGLPATLHLNAQGLVTTAQFFALWKAIEELAADPGLGFRLVEDTETAMHPPSSLAAFHARDYRDGLSRLARFKRLCTPEKLHIAEKNGECAIAVEWLHATAPAPAIAVDVDFATLVELGRRGTGKRPTPLRVEFARSGPKTDAHKSFFECRHLYISKSQSMASFRVVFGGMTAMAPRSLSSARSQLLSKALSASNAPKATSEINGSTPTLSWR